MGGMGGATPAPAPAPVAAAPAPVPAPVASAGVPVTQSDISSIASVMQQMMQQQMQQMQMIQQQMQQQMMQMQQQPAQVDPKVINTHAFPMSSMENGNKLNKEQSQNLDLIMSVPLEVSVEIGRTRRKVDEILTFSKGSLVVLDKLAGDQVDLYVNGMCVARGDVVVIEDNFGVRITEVLKKPGLAELASFSGK